MLIFNPKILPFSLPSFRARRYAIAQAPRSKRHHPAKPLNTPKRFTQNSQIHDLLLIQPWSSRWSRYAHDRKSTAVPWRKRASDQVGTVPRSRASLVPFYRRVSSRSILLGRSHKGDRTTLGYRVAVQVVRSVRVTQSMGLSLIWRLLIGWRSGVC
jgi:hypothetical protein